MKSTKARSSRYTVKGTSVQALPVTQTIRRSAVTPTSFVDPDNFHSAVQVLLHAQAHLLDAADRADFASSKAGTPIRTQEVRSKIDELTAEIRRIEQQILRAASTEFGSCGVGAQDLLRKTAGMRRGRQVEMSLDEELASAEFGVRRRTGNRRSLDGLNDHFGHRSMVRAFTDNLGKSQGFDQRGLTLGFTALRFGPLATKKSPKLPTAPQPKSADDLAAMSDEQLARLSHEELDQSIRVLLNVKNDASMSDKELKLALRLAGVVDPKNPELHLAALAAGNVSTLRALAKHVGFAHDLRDIAKSMTDAQLQALSTKDITGLIGVLARAGDDLEVTDDDVAQIQRVLSAFNNSGRAASEALRVVETAVGSKLLEVLTFSSVELGENNFKERELGDELSKLVGLASYALNFADSALATLIRSGDKEVAGFLFKSGVRYSPEILKIGFERFVVNKESFNENTQNFLILEPPGLRVLDALGSNPSAASLVLFGGKSADEAWAAYKKWLDGPDRLSKRRYWNATGSEAKWDVRDAADKETDLIAAMFLRAATHGYAAEHTGPGQGQFLLGILTQAVKEEGKYKLTDGGRVALAALLNDTMLHKDFANGYIVTLASGSSIALPGLRGAELLKFIQVLARSRRAADEITAGFGGLLNRVDIVDPFQDYRNAQNAGEAFKRVTRSINDGLKARSDEELATAQKYALLATVVASLTTGGLAAGAAAAGSGAGAVVWAGAGDGLMSYISGIPSDTFKALEVNDLVTFQFQRRILESETPGIAKLQKDPLVAKYLNENGTVKLPDPRELKTMMDDINSAFYRIDPTNSQHSQYPGPQGVLEKALSGWEKDTNK
jgi:hypothetical protein